MNEWDEIENARVPHAYVPRPCVVQWCCARDWFGDCTLTLEQWLENKNPNVKRIEKVRWFVAACAAVQPYLEKRYGPLRHAPRVGWDVRDDVTFFLFKADGDGVTFIVSAGGLADPVDDPSFFRDPASL